MKTLGYYNGKYDEIDKIMIPMSDRSHWFGDGVYDATCARNYKIMAIAYISRKISHQSLRFSSLLLHILS